MTNLPDHMITVLKTMNSKLKGRKIEKVEYDEENFPVIRLDDGTGIWIQCDDECNGPGVAVHVSQDKDGEQTEVGTYQLR